MPGDERRERLGNRRVRHTLIQQGQWAGRGDGECKEVPAAVTAAQASMPLKPQLRSRHLGGVSR